MKTAIIIWDLRTNANKNQELLRKVHSVWFPYENTLHLRVLTNVLEVVLLESPQTSNASPGAYPKTLPLRQLILQRVLSCNDPFARVWIFVQLVVSLGRALRSFTTAECFVGGHPFVVSYLQCKSNRNLYADSSNTPNDHLVRSLGPFHYEPFSCHQMILTSQLCVHVTCLLSSDQSTF